ncbi:MAG: ntrX [Verrucomicrobiales bacterium]|nr:ntrX [Verrucomicrobiales bacterium]
MRTGSAPWKATILVIEDDPDQVLLYRKALKTFRLRSVDTATSALSLLEEEIPDVIILDHLLAHAERGTDFLPALKDKAGHVPIVLITGTLNVQGQLKALQGANSAHYLIEKPVDIDELRKVVGQALDECGIAETVRSIRSLERAEMIHTSEPERQFAERLARQHELLKKLRNGVSAGERANVSALAREFRVSRRTIARDLQDLVSRGQLDPSVYPDEEA